MNLISSDQKTYISICSDFGRSFFIIARLVERIDVEAGNKITIKYKVSFERFMSADQASA